MHQENSEQLLYHDCLGQIFIFYNIYVYVNTIAQTAVIRHLQIFKLLIC